MKIAVIGTSSKSGDQGGAENFYKGLVSALIEHNVDAELICPISDETNFETIKETYLNFYDLDLSKYDGVISTKAPSYIIKHRNHICYLIHTMRVFYDMFESEFPYPSPELIKQKNFIIKLDSAALRYPRVKKIFSIGHEVTKRLLKFNQLKSEVLHPALLFDNFKCGEYHEYFFLPGRLHRWKRVDLAIRAIVLSKKPFQLKIAGVGEDETYYRKVANNDSRIEFLGRVTDEQLIDLYSNALAVPFTPIHEDYGYVTLEAFKSCKPVITCNDSGEPSHFVKNFINGFVCDPTPEAISEKMDYFFTHRDRAAEMGLNGKTTIEHITWKNIAMRLIQSLEMQK